MKAIKVGLILDNAARLAGRHVSGFGVPEEWKVTAALSLNAGLDRLAAEKLPMMTRTEFRRYRPEWRGDVAYSVGHEVFWRDGYWRLVGSGENAPGTSDDWRCLDAGEVAAFIAWEQPWEPTAMHRAGVDPARFAYTADPKYNPSATPLKVARVTSFGVELEAPAPKGIWCRFIPETPRFDFTEWTSVRGYERGDVAYVTTEKELYFCIADTADGAHPPQEDASHWRPVRVDGEFEAYLTRLVAVDFLTMDQGKQQGLQLAEAEFNKICEFYHEGNGETRIRRGRFR